MKRSGLVRVAALYGQVERVRLAALQHAAIAVDQAETLREIASAACLQQRGFGRAALALGEIESWRLAESLGDVAEVQVSVAEALRADRELARSVAGVDYLASRMETRRVAEVVERLALVKRTSQERREQAEADDRFAARLCWTRMKTG